MLNWLYTVLRTTITTVMYSRQMAWPVNEVANITVSKVSKSKWKSRNGLMIIPLIPYRGVGIMLQGITLQLNF